MMMTLFGVQNWGFEDSKTGITTDAYADALNWICKPFGDKTIILKNTHGLNSLHYKLLVRAKEDGQDAEEIAETTLAAGNLVRISRADIFSRMKLQVKAATAGAQATYQVDYIGHPPRAGGVS